MMPIFTKSIVLTDEERNIYEKRHSGLKVRLVAEELGMNERRVQYLYVNAQKKLAAQERLAKYHPSKVSAF